MCRVRVRASCAEWSYNTYCHALPSPACRQICLALMAYLGGKSEGGRGRYEPLRIAAINGRANVVAWLLNGVGGDPAKVFASVDAIDPEAGGTALYVACEHRHYDVIQILIEKGALSHKSQSCDPSTRNRHVQMLRYLVDSILWGIISSMHSPSPTDVGRSSEFLTCFSSHHPKAQTWTSQSERTLRTIQTTRLLSRW